MSYNVENYSKRDLYHEFLHVMGLLHEHQNKDRDKVITVKTNKFNSEFKVLQDLTEELYYDPTSIMHYHPRQGWVNNLLTMEMKVSTQ